jgi:arogenate dehydrogenase (NADP+)
VLASFPVQRLRRSTLVVDVLSVKVFPKNLFIAKLPGSCDILCLHPMFGPESGKGSWNGLPLVYDRVRVCQQAHRIRCALPFGVCCGRLSVYRRARAAGG